MLAFRKHVQPVWAGKPITYLEIGVFEGMSLVWMLQRVLTHPDSRAVGIDPWLELGKKRKNRPAKRPQDVMEEVRQRAEHNIEPWRERCRLVRGKSKDVLDSILARRRGKYGIRRNRVDLCMIDGSHAANAVLDDARRCIQLVRPGGWLIFDDVDDSPHKAGCVRAGVNQFLEERGEDLRLVWKSRYVETYERV